VKGRQLVATVSIQLDWTFDTLELVVVQLGCSLFCMNYVAPLQQIVDHSKFRLTVYEALKAYEPMQGNFTARFIKTSFQVLAHLHYSQITVCRFKNSKVRCKIFNDADVKYWSQIIREFCPYSSLNETLSELPQSQIRCKY
jgi:hypothetical protein